MKGPEHFAEAERLLEGANEFTQYAERSDRDGNKESRDVAMWSCDSLVARAQVHATLALAASQLRSLAAAQAAGG